MDIKSPKYFRKVFDESDWQNQFENKYKIKESKFYNYEFVELGAD